MTDLGNMTVMVTGGGSGIGRAACRRLAADGARVLVVDRDETAAGQTLEAVQSVGGTGLAVAADVTDPYALAAAVARANAAWGPVTGLVAAAGIASRGPIMDISLEDWQRGLDINLTGVFLSIRACLPDMLEQGSGAIVTIGSIASVQASPGGGVAYKASKGAVNLLTKAVAVDYAGSGVRANCLCPGSVATPFTGAVPTGSSAVVDASPLRRRAEPEEIASAAAFLLSEDASYITASTVMADGGFTAV